MRHSANAFLALLALAGGTVTQPGDARADDFADQVVSFAPGGGGPTPSHLGPENALGAPDYAGDNSCASVGVCTFVSLGDGGTLILEFTDNLLTGSDNADPDLWIYEVGSDVEDTFVAISTDNMTWHPVGKVFGSTSTVDIDAFGFGSSSMFRYVRLIDDTNEGGQSGPTVGADIDAVEALSSVAVGVAPTSWSGIKSRF